MGRSVMDGGCAQLFAITTLDVETRHHNFDRLVFVDPGHVLLASKGKHVDFDEDGKLSRDEVAPTASEESLSRALRIGCSTLVVESIHREDS